MSITDRKTILLALTARGEASRLDDDMNGLSDFEEVIEWLKRMGLAFISEQELDPATRYEKYRGLVNRYFLKPGSRADGMILLSWLDAKK